MQQAILDELRKDALEFFISGLNEVHPSILVSNSLKYENNFLVFSDIHDYSTKIDLNDFENIHVFGAGKCAFQMAQSLDRILSQKISDGLIISPQGLGNNLNKIKVFHSAHPIPDQSSYQAAHKLIEYLKTIKDNDLLIGLISGGASALLSFPVENITFDEKKYLTELLIKSGADISEINTVRKKLSKIKGGKLLNFVNSKLNINLIISDVVNDDPAVIGSGLTYDDKTLKVDALNVLEKYITLSSIPDSIMNFLKDNKNAVRADNSLNVKNLIIGNNRKALEEIKFIAEKKNYLTEIYHKNIVGDTESVAVFLSDYIKEKYDLAESNSKYCFIFGGETTVKVLGNGKGGRNQQLALSVAKKIKDIPYIIFLSAGTDGIDGNSDAVGAIVDNKTIEKGRLLNLDENKFLEENNTYEYFNETRDLITIGITGNNIMDIQIFIIKK